jgi:hypothetical protein
MRAVLALRLRSQAATWAASLGTDRKYKRPVRHASRPHGDGGGLRARSVARRSGAQQGVAWCCGRLDLLMRSLGAEAPSDRPDFDPNKVGGIPDEAITTRVDVRDYNERPAYHHRRTVPPGCQRLVFGRPELDPEALESCEAGIEGGLSSRLLEPI